MPSGGNRWLVWICRIVGLAVFALAFIEPAVRHGAAGPDATVFSGWKCASIALTETTALFSKAVSGAPPLPIFLVAMSGWINPLIVLFLLLCVSSRLRIARGIVAVIILLCMGATWMFFHLQSVTPLIGHFLWIGGALLILLPDAFGSSRRAGA